MDTLSWSFELKKTKQEKAVYLEEWNPQINIWTAPSPCGRECSWRLEDFILFYFSLTGVCSHLQEFLISEDFNKMNHVKTYPGMKFNLRFYGSWIKSFFLYNSKHNGAVLTVSEVHGPKIRSQKHSRLYWGCISYLQLLHPTMKPILLASF